MPSLLRMNARVARSLFCVLALALFSAACLKVDFDPASVVNTVRIFATRADKPYAKPGDKVELEVLAYDGRPNPAAPMKIYWIPLPCLNPPRDLYYLCFAQFVYAGGRANPGGAPTLPIKPGTDITDFLPQGPKFSFTMPDSAIASHPFTPGSPAPYGMAIFFNIACAGRVEIEEQSSDNPQNIPLGCYDAAGNKLGPDDYVIGFTRVYAYADVANQNPVITNVTFDEKPVGPEGIVVDRCLKDQFKDCDTKKIGVNVPDESWELNPLAKDANGHPAREQIWAAYYGTIGRYDSEIRLLFDSLQGRVGDTDNKLRIPREPGTGRVWIVVRDNRGGATWQEIPIKVQ